ncbi:MAG: hypothetical protein WCU88_09245 [Elusimicrobiota bacterium]|jgi:hypothetical protein
MRRVIGLFKEHPALSARVAALLLLIFAHPRSQGFYLLGFLFVAAGQWLRFWTSGHPQPACAAAEPQIGSSSAKERTSASFSEGGPYACLARPMETGTVLAAAGFVLMSTSFTRWGSSLFLWLALCAWLCTRLSPFVAEQDRRSARGWLAAAEQLLPDAGRLRTAWENGRYDPALARAADERGFVRLALILAVFLRFKLAYRL